MKKTLLIASLLSFFWVLPVFSVHSFVETACIPPLLIAIYYSHKIEREDYSLFWICLASFAFALAFTFRFQTFVFGVGIGSVLLYQKQFKKAFALLGCTIFSLFITMGIFVGSYLVLEHRLVCFGVSSKEVDEGFLFGYFLQL